MNKRFMFQKLSGESIMKMPSLSSPDSMFFFVFFLTFLAPFDFDPLLSFLFFIVGAVVGMAVVGLAVVGGDFVRIEIIQVMLSMSHQVSQVKTYEDTMSIITYRWRGCRGWL